MRDELVPNLVRHISSVHVASGRPNVCILSSPRSGSTWLMELILSQPGFKPCNEPFNIRKSAVARRLNLANWEDLYSDQHLGLLEAYLRTFLTNSYSAAFKNLRPGNRHYRPITTRIAFKILHACENRVDWLQQTLNARIVLLIRHPIPVALSREELPRLNIFLDSDFRRLLSPEQRQLAADILARDNELERAILDWCLQNCIPLQHFRDSFLLVTYEQLVLRPEPALSALAEYLELDSIEKMQAKIDRPSGSTSKSGAETVRFLQASGGEDGDRKWLVEKWRARVTEEQESSLMSIVSAFGLDIYRSGDALPAEPYWL